MAKKETLFEFVDNFKNLDGVIDKNILKGWNRATNIVRGEAIERAPVASGDLAGSSSRIVAKITPNGIKSAVIFKEEYAKALNDKNSGLKLKSSGELSYVVYPEKVGHVGKKKGVYRGTQVSKKKKGELGFLDNAVDSKEHLFLKIIDDAISFGWDKI